MLTLSELEREKILSERQDKRQIAKEAWMLQHQKKKQAQAQAVAAAQQAAATKDRGELQQACGYLILVSCYLEQILSRWRHG
jgi:hypothetical protein